MQGNTENHNLPQPLCSWTLNQRGKRQKQLCAHFDKLPEVELDRLQSENSSRPALTGVPHIQKFLPPENPQFLPVDWRKIILCDGTEQRKITILKHAQSIHHNTGLFSKRRKCYKILLWSGGWAVTQLQSFLALLSHLKEKKKTKKDFQRSQPRDTGHLQDWGLIISL